MTDWCERHWNIVLSRNLNGIAASMLMMQALLANKDFMTKCERDAANMNRVKTGIAPICCYLGDDKMEEIFENPMCSMVVPK